MMDARFHALSSAKTLEQQSPDWIIAKNFGKQGLSKPVHEVMGIFLGISTLSFLYFFYYLGSTNKFTKFYMQILYPTFLFMIITAILLKNYYKDTKGTVAIF